MEASVVSYEDVQDKLGDAYTMYLVRVQLLQTGPKNSNKPDVYSGYFVSKRYSDFRKLYKSVRHLLPSGFNLPRKSMFHTFEEDTKLARVQAFNTMLEILLNCKERPTELRQFLEVNLHLDSVLARVSILGENPAVTNSKPRHTEMTGVTMREVDIHIKLYQISQYLKPIIESDDNKLLSEEEIEGYAPLLVWEGMMLSAVFYSACIFMNIVNISQTTLYSIILTYIMLSILFSFMDLYYLRSTGFTLTAMNSLSMLLFNKNLFKNIFKRLWYHSYLLRSKKTKIS